MAASAAAIKSAILGTTVAASTATPSILASVAAGMPFVLGPILSGHRGRHGRGDHHDAIQQRLPGDARLLAVTPSRRNRRTPMSGRRRAGCSSSTARRPLQVMTGKFMVQDCIMQAEGGFGADVGLSLKAAFKMVGMMGSQLAVERSKQKTLSEGFAMKGDPPTQQHPPLPLPDPAGINNFAFSDPYGKAPPGKADAYRFSDLLPGWQGVPPRRLLQEGWWTRNGSARAATPTPPPCAVKDRSTKSKPAHPASHDVRQPHPALGHQGGRRPGDDGRAGDDDIPDQQQSTS